MTRPISRRRGLLTLAGLTACLLPQSKGNNAMISDDLSRLFAPNPQGLTQAFAVALGSVVAYSASDGSNIININNAMIPNVPIMRVGSSINLTVGDTVLCARIGHGFVVIGSVEPVNVANFLADNNQAEWAHNTTTGFGSVVKTLVTQQVTVPSFAGFFDVVLTSSVKTAGTAGHFLSTHAYVSWTDNTGTAQSKQTTQQIQEYGTAGDLVHSTSNSLVWGGTLTPGTTVEIGVVLESAAGTTDDGGAAASVSGRFGWGRGRLTS